MSSIEYRVLLNCKLSQGIDWLTEGTTLLSLCEAEGLIAADSVNNIENVPSLFTELEQQNNLGIDNLDTLKELLRGIEKWALIDAVDKFEIKRENYISLLEKVILKLEELNDPNRLVAICRPYLAEDTFNRINSVRALFKELQSNNRLGANRLKILKQILTETGKEDLKKEVENFEQKRKDEDRRDRQRMESEERNQGELLHFTRPKLLS